MKELNLGLSVRRSATIVETTEFLRSGTIEENSDGPRSFICISLASLLPAAAFAQSSQSSLSLEATHAADTLEAGTVALETSRVALTKATDPNVKRFAQFEAAEQETVATVIKAASRIAEVPKPSGDRKAMIDTIAALPAGKSFDAAYVKGQIDGHQKLLAIQEAYLAAGKDVTHRSIAALARGHIKVTSQIWSSFRSQPAKRMR